MPMRAFLISSGARTAPPVTEPRGGPVRYAIQKGHEEQERRGEW